MNSLLSHLEKPIPRLTLDVSRIDIEGAGVVKGSFKIKNTGEGELVGRIVSGAGFLDFSPEVFSGNDININYSLNLEGIRSGRRAEAVITSNGGEKPLVFDIKINPPDITCPCGTKISTLEHFLDYVRKSPVASRQLFMRRDFLMWLFNMGYSSMDVYERFASDPNKERAVDNFLVFNSLKNKAKLLLPEKDIMLAIPPWESAITGGIKIKRSTWGYVEGSLSLKTPVDWLKLDSTKITGANFNEDNAAEISYIILPEELKKRDMAHIELECDNPQSMYIHARPAPAFEAKLDRESYSFEDSGKLIVKNNTGKDLMIDIYCENFIKFEAKRYFISKQAEIDFDIKFGSFKAATLALKKQLYASSKMHVSAVSGGRNTVKELSMKLWAH